MKLLLCCTKQPHKLFNTDKGFVLSDFELGDFYKDKTLLNGKIVAECDFEVEEIAIHRTDVAVGFDTTYYTEKMEVDKLIQYSCLGIQEMENYLGTKKDNGEICGYAIHIKNLHIFNKPRELSDYYIIQNENANPIDIEEDIKTVKKAPQNMMYCWDFNSELDWDGKCNRYFKKKIIVSIRPEWLCKILNGEKTIEVRKKVLKERL